MQDVYRCYANLRELYREEVGAWVSGGVGREEQGKTSAVSGEQV